MKKVLLILAEGFEEIEAISVIDILRRAGVSVLVAGLKGTAIKGSHGIVVNADKELLKVYNEDFDMVVLPGGGLGTKNLSESKEVLSLLSRFIEEDKFVTAICAAPTVLAKAEVVGDHKVTSYPGTEGAFNKANYLEQRVVESGKMITSRGPATAMDFALALVKALVGEEMVRKLKQDMVY